METTEKKQVFIKLHHIRSGECIEVWQSKPENGKCTYYARDTYSGHSWSYLSDAPNGYCEKVCYVSDNIEFAVCDKKWNVILFDGNDSEKYPNGFFTLEEMCKLKWAHIQENRFPNVTREGFSAWLDKKKPANISYDDSINWTSFRFETVNKETLSSFTWIGEEYIIIRVHQRHTLCEAEWYDYFASRKDREQYESYISWFGCEFNSEM